MSLRLQRGNLSNSCIVMPNISWKTSGAKWRFKKKQKKEGKKQKGEKAMVSQSQRDTTGGWSALGISSRCVRAIAAKNNALAIHVPKSSRTWVPKESIRELFHLLNKQEVEKSLVWSHPTSSDRPENRTSSCTPVPGFSKSPLPMEIRTDLGFSGELCRGAAGWHAPSSEKEDVWPA